MTSLLCGCAIKNIIRLRVLTKGSRSKKARFFASRMPWRHRPGHMRAALLWWPCRVEMAVVAARLRHGARCMLQDRSTLCPVFTCCRSIRSYAPAFVGPTLSDAFAFRSSFLKYKA